MIVTRGYGSGAIVTRGYSATSDYEFIGAYFLHIWPAKYDPLTISSLVTRFSIDGLASSVDIHGLPVVFWTNGRACVTYIKSIKS